MIRRLDMDKLVAAVKALQSEISIECQTIQDLAELVRITGEDIGAVCEKLPCLTNLTTDVVHILLQTGRVNAITHAFGYALLLGVRVGMKMSEAEALQEFHERS